MIETVVFGKSAKLLSIEGWPVIGNELLRKAMSGKVGFQLGYDLTTQGGTNAINFDEVRKNSWKLPCSTPRRLE